MLAFMLVSGPLPGPTIHNFAVVPSGNGTKSAGTVPEIPGQLEPMPLPLPKITFSESFQECESLANYIITSCSTLVYHWLLMEI